MEYGEVIKNRYSVRDFSSKKIEDEKLEKILEAGLIAPTARNIQPLKIFVIQSKENLEKINLVSPCIYGANTVLAICYDVDISAKNVLSGEDSGEQDASIVCTHMMLEATNLGLGSVWVGMFDSNKFREFFNLPKNIIPVCLLPVGYIGENAKPSINHTKRKNKDEIYVRI